METLVCPLGYLFCDIPEIRNIFEQCGLACAHDQLCAPRTIKAIQDVIQTHKLRSRDDGCVKINPEGLKIAESAISAA